MARGALACFVGVFYKLVNLNVDLMFLTFLVELSIVCNFVKVIHYIWNNCQVTLESNWLILHCGHADN